MGISPSTPSPTTAAPTNVPTLSLTPSPTLSPTTAATTIAPTLPPVIECPNTGKDRWGVCGCFEADVDADNDGFIDCASDFVFHENGASVHEAIEICELEGGYLPGPSEYAAAVYFLDTFHTGWGFLMLDAKNKQSSGNAWFRQDGEAFPPDHAWAVGEPRDFTSLGDPNARCTMFQKGWGLVTVPCRDLEGSFVCRFTNKLDFRNDPKKYVAARRDCKGDNGRLAEAPTDLRLYNISSAAVEDFGATSGEYFWIGAKNRCKGDGAVWGDTDRIVDKAGHLSADADCYECLAVKAGASDAGSVEYMYEDCRESLKYMCEGTFNATAIFPPEGMLAT
jgi:hypothetical protein